jgi:hypothetical protein
MAHAAFQIAADPIPRLPAARTGRSNLENEMPINPPRGNDKRVGIFWSVRCPTLPVINLLLFRELPNAAWRMELSPRLELSPCRDDAATKGEDVE